MIKSDLFPEEYLVWLCMRERYIAKNCPILFFDSYHDGFAWNDKQQDSFLLNAQLTNGTNLTGKFEETLLAYTFIYEYRSIDDEGILLPLYIYYLSYIYVLNPNKLLYRRHLKSVIPLTGTSFLTNKLYTTRMAFSALEDAFLNPDGVTTDSNVYWSANIMDPKYFKPFIHKHRRYWRTYRPVKRLLEFVDDDLFYLEQDPYKDVDSYLLDRMQNLRKFDVKLFNRFNLASLRQLNSKLRVKFFSIHKPKVRTRFTEREKQELIRLKEVRKIKLQRTKRDPDLIADLIDDNYLPESHNFFEDDYYRTEFFNPHSRD